MSDVTNMDTARRAGPADNGNGNPRSRKAQPRQTVPVGPTETIRHRLGMNNENFSEALGFHPSTYAGYVQKNRITKTGALAAEALMRRQQASGEVSDMVFVIRVIKGVPTAIELAGLQKMTLNGQEFYLVPVGDTRT